MNGHAYISSLLQLPEQASGRFLVPAASISLLLSLLLIGLMPGAV